MDNHIVSRMRKLVKDSAEVGCKARREAQLLKKPSAEVEQKYKESLGKIIPDDPHRRKIRKTLRNPATGLERHRILTVSKISQGRVTRSLMLAYGFLRGVPYKVLERKCAHGNEMSAHNVWRHVEAVLVWREHNLGPIDKKVTFDDVGAWLTVASEKQAVAA